MHKKKKGFDCYSGVVQKIKFKIFDQTKSKVSYFRYVLSGLPPFLADHPNWEHSHDSPKWEKNLFLVKIFNYFNHDASISANKRVGDTGCRFFSWGDHPKLT